MIKIFKYLKCLSPPIINEIFRLRNIPYTIRNPRDLNSRLPKAEYCGLEIIAYKRLQSWQQLPVKIKRSSSLVSFGQNITLWKNPKCSCPVCKRQTKDLNSHKKTMQSKFYFNIIFGVFLYC